MLGDGEEERTIYGHGESDDARENSGARGKRIQAIKPVQTSTTPSSRVAKSHPGRAESAEEPPSTTLTSCRKRGAAMPQRPRPTARLPWAPTVAAYSAAVMSSIQGPSRQRRAPILRREHSIRSDYETKRASRGAHLPSGSERQGAAGRCWTCGAKWSANGGAGTGMRSRGPVIAPPLESTRLLSLSPGLDGDDIAWCFAAGHDGNRPRSRLQARGETDGRKTDNGDRRGRPERVKNSRPRKYFAPGTLGGLHCRQYLHAGTPGGYRKSASYLCSPTSPTCVRGTGLDMTVGVGIPGRGRRLHRFGGTSCIFGADVAGGHQL